MGKNKTKPMNQEALTEKTQDLEKTNRISKGFAKNTPRNAK
jgi:hypothetical protein